MTCYRIYTENKRLKWIKSVLDNFLMFDGYTIYKTEGYYKGIKEKSIVIEILYDDRYFRSIELRIETLVKMLKGYNKQDAVLVTKNHVDLLEN